MATFGGALARAARRSQRRRPVDYHSRQRAATTRHYASLSRGQIAAQDRYSRAGQAAAHRWFSHTAWQNRRDAVVARRKRERAARQQRVRRREDARVQNVFQAASMAMQAQEIRTATQARSRARQRTQAARNRLPQQVRAPAIPLLDEYTPKQRRTAERLTRNAERRAGGRANLRRDPDRQTALRLTAADRAAAQTREAFWARQYRAKVRRDVLGYSPEAIGFKNLSTKQKREVRTLAPMFKELRRGRGMAISQQAQVGRALAGIRQAKRRPSKPSGGFSAGPLRGLPVGVAFAARSAAPVRNVMEAPAKLAGAPYHVTRALIESGAARRETLKGFRDLPAGIVQGVGGLIMHPGKTADAIRKDFAHRYGPLLAGDTSKFRRQLGQKHSGGAASFALDFAGTGAGASALLGRAGRSGVLTSRVKRTMTEPRPKLRYGHGKGMVREQELSTRLVKALVQRKRDRSRGRVYDRRVARAGESGPRPPAPRRGEVTSRGGMAVRGRVVAPLPERLYHGRMAARDVARMKGRARLAQTAEQRASMSLIASALSGRRGKLRLRKNLNRREKEAFRYAYGGLMNTRSRAAAVKDIDALIALKRQGREDAGVEVPRGRRESNEEIRTLERLREAVEKGDVDLESLRGAAKIVRREEIRIARRNPKLQAIPEQGRVQQAALRRYMPQAEFLSHRGLLPAMRDGEAVGAFINRIGLRKVIAAAKEAGLDHPGYFPSERRFRHRVSNRAVGGAKPTPEHKTYTGALFRTGREDVRPEVLVQGLMRGVKEKHNVKLMADVAEKFGIAVPKGAEAATRTGKEAGRRGRREAGKQDGAELVAEARRQGGRNMDRAEEEARVRGMRVERNNDEIAELRESLEAVREQLRAHPDKDAARAELVAERTRIQNRIRRRRRKITELEEAGAIKPTARVADDPPLPTARQQRAAQDRIALAREPAAGRTPKEIIDDLDDAQIDIEGVRLYNPGRVHRQLAGSGIGDDLKAPAIQGSRDIQGALRDHTAELVRGEDGQVRVVRAGGQVDATSFNRSRGWVAVPKEIMAELESGYVPESLGARLWDISKGKISRVLLGYGNVSWLAFQVASNAFLTGLVGHVGPGQMIRAQLWWKRLPKDQRQLLEQYVGASPHFADYDVKKLGIHAVNNKLVETWRALQSTHAWRLQHKVNPITGFADLMFRGDQLQNRFFRRALLYNEAKRTAMRNLSRDGHALMSAQSQVTSFLSPKRMDAQVNKVLRDFDQLETHAKKVDDLLGDYLTFTHNERRILQRYVMFYGFLRHSLKLTLWTMPTQHPVVSSILGRLGEMGADEARELLDGDQLPWGLGKVYWKGKGQLMEIDLTRLNPATNVLTDLRDPRQIFRMFPPFVSYGLEQALGMNLMTGKPWRVRGITQGLPLPGTTEGYTWQDRLRVGWAQVERLLPPVNYIRRGTQHGVQGDDASLLLGERPLRYKRPDIVESIERGVRRDRAIDPATRIIREALPMLPQPSIDPEIVQNRAKRDGSKARSSDPFTRKLQAIDDRLGGTGKTPLDRKLEAIDSRLGDGSGLDPALERKLLEIDRRLGGG